MEVEARFYAKLKDKAVQCRLCPHFCVIGPGKRGKCGARENRGGKLISVAYGKVCSMALDPIEKKPFYHFFPGSETLTIATAGCNLSCKHCQNWTISQKEIEQIKYQEFSPEQIIALCRQAKSKIISFSYTEPTIFYEYMLDIAKLSRESGIKTAMITNGFINPEPLRELIQYIDAFNVDLKGMSEKFYRDICGARLSPVLEALKIIHKSGKHLEITNLIIPGYNDSREMIEKLIRWIVDNLDGNVPLHFSAFNPCYQMTKVSRTLPSSVINSAELAKKLGMKNVYTGNI